MEELRFEPGSNGLESNALTTRPTRLKHTPQEHTPFDIPTRVPVTTQEDLGYVTPCCGEGFVTNSERVPFVVR